MKAEDDWDQGIIQRAFRVADYFSIKIHITITSKC